METNMSLGAVDNSSTNATTRFVSPVISSISWLLCFWIVLAHGAIVACFLVNRSKPWTTYSKQILSLSLNDLSVGMVCLIILAQFRLGMNDAYAVCAISYYFYFAALCANLYHVLAICIHRAMMLVRKPTTAEPTSVRLVVVLVTLAWIPAFCLCAVAFAVWGNNHLDVPKCRVERFFGTRTTALGFLATCYVIPLICTNVIYGTTCCKLLLMWKKVFPIAVTKTGTETSQNSISSSNTRPGIRAQRKAITTIGLLLLFFNLFSLPLIVIMVVMFSGGKVDRNTRVLLSNVFVLNSVTSPFIYASRTKYLAQALKDYCRDCVRCLLGQEGN